MGHASTTELEAPKNTTKPSRVQEPRVTSPQTFTSTNPRGESKPMQLMQMARAQVLKSFTLKFQQSYKCLWGNKRERTKEEKHQELQDLDPLSSPHLEGRWIGGNVDLDLLSLFPQRYARIMGGIERRQAFQGQQWWRREGKNVLSKAWLVWGRRWGVFIAPPQNRAVTAH